MNLRTPRRRISPQTKRRCRAIKGFFKRALGSLSQPDLLHITSSIAVNVTDINHRILGLEQQLQEVCKTCRDHHHEINSVQSKSGTPNQVESGHVISHRDIPSVTKLKEKETYIIYSKPENQYESTVQSGYEVRTNVNNRVKSENTMYTDFNDDRTRLKKKKSKVSNRENDCNIEKNYRNRNNESSHKNFLSAYSTSSFHSLDQLKKKYQSKPNFLDNIPEKRIRAKVQNNNHSPKIQRKLYPERCEEKTENDVKKKKSRHRDNVLDPDFIADIIRRQYKPVKFGRRNSDLSQFSAPMCRDREFCLAADYYNIPEERPLRTGCHCNRFSHHSDFSDMRSVCDARLYNMRHSTRAKHHRRLGSAYDNSEFYDLVPVKEKSSPKSRRKFIEDNMHSAYYKEVPPSPRTHRPQLNLDVRYAESDYNVELARNYRKRILPKHATRHRKMEEYFYRTANRNVISPKSPRRGNEEFEESYDPYEIEIMRRNNKMNKEDTQHDSITTSIYPVLTTEDPTVPVEISMNKTQETVLSDKTDKTLNEIKDILQNFLLEIKKESSHNPKLNDIPKMTESGNSPLNNVNTMTSTRHSFSNFNSVHCPVAPSPFMPTLPPFANTCCYPLMPICPINCMQNGFPMHSASFTHNTCVDKSNETSNVKSNTDKTCETDELIKEIYKFVSQSPTFCRKNGSYDSKKEIKSNQTFRKGLGLTSRSVGGSTRICRNDAKVGTTKMNCASKSCEAIKMSSEAYSSDTNVSYSETVLDKLSLEATQSYSETESSTEVTEVEKVKRSKLAKLLNSFVMRKKVKKDVIEELSESEKTTVEKSKKKPPFRQNITNYAVHGQDYYEPPPVSPNYRPAYQQNSRPPYNPNARNANEFGSMPPNWDPRLQQSKSHGSPQPHYRPEYPTAPPQPQAYPTYQAQPQVPLCLKEVEVKSIGCQSERKLSFFKKITQRMHSADSSQDDTQKNGTTQTPRINTTKPQNKPGLFNWKNPQSNYMDRQINPLTFGYQTQRQLARGDMKMRNAMLKKMFNKRNPFSPRNAIVRTLMGKDRASYGEPQSTFRPRLFM